MPPRLPLSARGVRLLSHEPYVCLSCLLKTGRGQRTPRVAQRRQYSSAGTHGRSQYGAQSRVSFEIKRQHGPRLGYRWVSNGSLASTTAINAPTTVPPAYRELYQSLMSLQERAGSYVDLSRLQLAMRSLESSNPVIRVALLGLGSRGERAARKLARVFLSDVLSQEESFEREIIDVGDGISLLLRHGEDAERVTPTNPLVRTMNVPSRFVERHNIEILVSTFNSEGNFPSRDGQSALEEAILVPSLTTPNSADGRVGFVRYPVHKAVVVAEGITGAVDYGRFPAALADGSLISAALNIPLLRSFNDIEAGDQQLNGNEIDIDLATHALNVFRESKANGAQFSDEWQISRVPALASWITGSKDQASNSRLNPAVHDLISSILSKASTSISVSQDAEMNMATANTVPNAKRTIVQSAISDWSAEAHRDLQNNLDSAFTTSPSWRRTAWWRLFWRIDDVTVSAADVLRNSWLTEAEQKLAFLSGRIFDSGLATAEQLAGPTPLLLEPGRKEEMQEYEANKSQPETVAELMRMPSMLSRMQQQSGVNALFHPPWPQNINLSRQFMLQSLVPDLHRKAQALLITTLTTISGSAALSVWFFVATAGLGVYESGAVIALGLVWSLRRLQRRWSKEREGFADAVREDARRVLGEVEGHLTRVVNEGGKPSVRREDERVWEEAKEVVEGCSEALGKLSRRN